MVKDKKFKFELKQEVEITCSGETGIVTCRMDNMDGKDQFRVRYKAGDGRAAENWWDQSALKAVSAAKPAAKKAPAKKAPAPAAKKVAAKKTRSKKAPVKKV